METKFRPWHSLLLIVFIHLLLLVAFYQCDTSLEIGTSVGDRKDTTVQVILDTRRIRGENSVKNSRPNKEL